jgi:two-component system sensor kinase FixL
LIPIKGADLWSIRHETPKFPRDAMGVVMTTEHQRTDSLFRTLIGTAVDGIIVINEKGIVEIYSTACERLFGYAAEEVVGNNVKMLMPSPYREEHDAYISHYRKTGERRIIGIGREVVGRRKDGTTFPMYLSVGEGRIDDKRIFVGIIHDLTPRDITARRMQELQSELLHVSRLSAMGQMTAALAHELNQPLTAIMNYVNAARRTIAAAQGPEAARATDLIDKAAKQTARAGQIIRQLREFVEKRESARALMDLNKVVEEAIALGLVGSIDASIKLRTRLAPNLPQVLIDKIQIQQVVINLVRNSIEAMMAVATRELAVETKPGEKGFVEVSVSDTGPGLPEEVASRLFQPFVTTKDKGMGVGLSICQSIIEAHNGRIWATPNDGRGVTFHFRLPSADA